VSTPANETIKAPTGSVGRLVDRLLQQDPQLPCRFSVSEDRKPGRALQLLSVYSDDKGVVWVDIG